MFARTGRGLFIGGLMLAYILVAWHSAVHLDLARDTRVALDIRDGLAAPLTGPVLAGQFHLGPSWYYLLALLYSGDGSWLRAVVFLAVLASLQFPLAYHAGKALLNRSAGILWASLLLMPSWSTFEQVFPAHTQLTAALVAATICCLARYYKDSKDKYLVIGALVFALALHAHPSTVILALPLIMSMITRWHRKRLLAGPASAIALAGFLPFLPLWVEQWRNGFNMFQLVGGYAETVVSQVAATAVPKLFWQIGVGGIQYWWEALLGWDTHVGQIAYFAYAFVILAGLLSVALFACKGSTINALILATLLATLIVLTFIRSHHPYYLTTVYRVMLLGAVALGMAGLLDRGKGRYALVALLAVPLGMHFAVMNRMMEWQRNGDWPLAIFPLFDVTSSWQQQQALAMLPANAMSKSGEWLCTRADVVLHGSYGVHLLHGYALEVRLACPGHPVRVGGQSDSMDRWIGLSRAMIESIHAKAVFDIGAFGLMPVKRILNPDTVGAINPLVGGYPPVVVDSLADESVSIKLKPMDAKWIAVTNLAFAFAPFPDLRLSVGGRELRPEAQDWMTAIFVCEACSHDSSLLEIKGSATSFVDVVAF